MRAAASTAVTAASAMITATASPAAVTAAASVATTASPAAVTAAASVAATASPAVASTRRRIALRGCRIAAARRRIGARRRIRTGWWRIVGSRRWIVGSRRWIVGSRRWIIGACRGVVRPLWRAVGTPGARIIRPIAVVSGRRRPGRFGTRSRAACPRRTIRVVHPRGLRRRARRTIGASETCGPTTTIRRVALRFPSSRTIARAL
jgi:hypothetical protein